MNNEQKESNINKMTPRRILAIVVLVLIACLYAATIVFALIDSPFAKSCLMAALFCTIVVPAVIYGFLVITRQISGNGKHSKDTTDEKQEK